MPTTRPASRPACSSVIARMDSKTVSSQIRHRLWPQLRDAGFAVFTSRTAWRHGPTRIDFFNVQSFNASNAELIGCTTYSFAVNLGCFFLAIPSPFEPSRTKCKAGRLLPDDHECHFRGRLMRSFEQPALARRDIWYVDPDGRAVDRAMADVEQLLGRTALPWFADFAADDHALSLLLDADETDECWGFGRRPSPVRHYYTGYLALAHGRRDLAHTHLRLAVESGCFEAVRERLLADIRASEPAKP